MTPQERALVQDLFERLASLEGERRDPDAERLIEQGLSRAPSSVYALVQTVLVQDEALKRANARIEELQHGGTAEEQPQGGFLDTVRNAMFGSQPQGGAGRGSVPSVGGQPRASVWGSGTTAPPQNGGYAPQGYGQQGYAQQQQPAPGTGGGSFLGTAAAGAAGVIGGALLMNSISSMFRGGGGMGHAAYDSNGVGGSPWSGGGEARGSDLSREAGLNDIGGGGRDGGGLIEDRRGERAGFFGGDDNAQNDGGYDVADSGDAGGDFGGNNDA